MNYMLTDEASYDLDYIFLEGCRIFGLQQADRYSIELDRIFEMIAKNPRIARERLEIEPVVRAHPHKSHIIIYRIENDGVAILGVRHAHEDWMNDPV
jgi:toxin ParE1/3/4